MKKFEFDIPEHIYDYMLSEHKNMGITIPFEEFVHTLLSSVFTDAPILKIRNKEADAYMERMVENSRVIEADMKKYLENKNETI